MAGTPVQLQDALKCQHCRKQFKSKAGLNYHTMAEHSAKVRPGPLITGLRVRPSPPPARAPACWLLITTGPQSSVVPVPDRGHRWP